MPAINQMQGLRFGRLVVSHLVRVRKGFGAIWLCTCDCGLTCKRSTKELNRAGKLARQQSCGCFKVERCKLLGEQCITHGFGGTKIYDVWRQMRLRCSDPTHKDYPGWGGRGIRVCEEWNDIHAFVAWAGANGYGDGVTIERVDNMRGYSPENCCWIPNARQAKNSRRQVLVTIDGVTKDLSDWALCSGISVRTLIGRARRGWPPERMLIAAVVGRNQSSAP